MVNDGNTLTNLLTWYPYFNKHKDSVQVQIKLMVNPNTTRSRMRRTFKAFIWGTQWPVDGWVKDGWIMLIDSLVLSSIRYWACVILIFNKYSDIHRAVSVLAHCRLGIANPCLFFYQTGWPIRTHGFEPWLNQTNDLKIDTCGFLARRLALLGERKDAVPR